MFTSRRKFNLTGTRVVKAKRSTPIATVGTIRAYLEDHVTGGSRTRTAIPGKKLRRNPRQVVTRRRWPGALRSGPFFFLRLNQDAPAELRSKFPGIAAVLFRRGRGGRRKLRIMWTIRDSQPVKKRWDFQGVVEQAAIPEFRRSFPIRFAEALKTARPE